jgi:hypothetical protein
MRFIRIMKEVGSNEPFETIPIALEIESVQPDFGAGLPDCLDDRGDPGPGSG